MSKIRSIEENKMNDEKLDLGLLFAKWLINNRGVDFDTYVELYSNNLAVKQEIDRQTELVDYAERKKEVK
jgi:hypothetical protein